MKFIMASLVWLLAAVVIAGVPKLDDGVYWERAKNPLTGQWTEWTIMRVVKGRIGYENHPKYGTVRISDIRYHAWSDGDDTGRLTDSWNPKNNLSGGIFSDARFSAVESEAKRLNAAEKRQVERQAIRIDEPPNEPEVKTALFQKQGNRLVVQFVKKDCPFCGALQPQVIKARLAGFDVRQVNIDKPDILKGTNVTGLQMVHLYYDAVGVPRGEQRTVPAFFSVVQMPHGGLTDARLLQVSPDDELMEVLATEGVRKVPPAGKPVP